MLYQIQGNQVTLYHAVFNKNRLKAIRKKVIAKYSKPTNQMRMSYKDFMQLWHLGDEEPQHHFIVTKLQKIKIYERNICIATDCIFQTISQPDLAIIIDEILHGHEDMIESLIPYYEYFHAKSENSKEKLDEFYHQYGIFFDLDGYIYIEEILKNLKLISAYQDIFIDISDLIHKLKQHGNILIEPKIDEIEPKKLSCQMVTKIKKLDYYQNKKSESSFC